MKARGTEKENAINAKMYKNTTKWKICKTEKLEKQKSNHAPKCI